MYNIHFIEFIFNAVLLNCVALATDCNGCYLIERCLEIEKQLNSSALASELSKHVLMLMNDKYGNYVVQNILNTQPAVESAAIYEAAYGRILSLSVQKYSSNVIEKCFVQAPDYIKRNYIDEMASSELVGTLISDKFGNFVLQRVLELSADTPSLRENLRRLVCALQPHVRLLQAWPKGKRLLKKLAKSDQFIAEVLDMS